MHDETERTSKLHPAQWSHPTGKKANPPVLQHITSAALGLT